MAHWHTHLQTSGSLSRLWLSAVAPDFPAIMFLSCKRRVENFLHSTVITEDMLLAGRIMWVERLEAVLNLASPWALLPISFALSIWNKHRGNASTSCETDRAQSNLGSGVLLWCLVGVATSSNFEANELAGRWEFRRPAMRAASSRPNNDKQVLLPRVMTSRYQLRYSNQLVSSLVRERRLPFVSLVALNWKDRIK